MILPPQEKYGTFILECLQCVCFSVSGLFKLGRLIQSQMHNAMHFSIHD